MADKNRRKVYTVVMMAGSAAKLGVPADTNVDVSFTDAQLDELAAGLAPATQEDGTQTLTGGWNQVDGNAAINDVFPPESEFDFPFFFGTDDSGTAVVGMIAPDESIIKFKISGPYQGKSGDTIYGEVVPLPDELKNIVVSFADRASTQNYIDETITAEQLTDGGNGWSYFWIAPYHRLEKTITVNGKAIKWYIHTYVAPKGLVVSIHDAFGGDFNSTGHISSILATYK